MIKKTFITLLLAIIFPPLAFLYIERLYWAIVSTLLIVGLWICAVFYRETATLNVSLIIAITYLFFIVCAVFLAVRFRRNSQPIWYAQWKGILGIVCLVVVCEILIDSFLYGIYVIPSESMLPNYKKGDYILVEKWPYQHYRYKNWLIYKGDSKKRDLPVVGDVMVYFSDEKNDYIVKRIVAVAGDHIRINGREMLINQQRIPLIDQGSGIYQEQMAGSYDVQYLMSKYPYPVVDQRIEKGFCYVLGDNRNNAMDSRIAGPLNTNALVGRVITRF